MTALARLGQQSWLPYLSMAGGIFLLSVMDAVVKTLSVDYPTFQIVAVRYWGALLVLAPFVLRAPGGISDGNALRAGAIRGGLTFVAAGCFFHALSLIPLAIAITLGFTTPFLVTLTARVFLGETFGLRTIGAMLMGLTGVMVVMASQILPFRPGPDTVQTLFGSALVLVASMCVAGMFVMMRARSGRDGAVRMTFLQTGTAALLATAPGVVSWQSIALGDWPLFVSTGILGAGGISLIAAAFLRAPAARLAPFDYTAFLWAVLLGYVFFQEPLALSTLVGAALIVAGCLLATGNHGET